MSVSKDSEEADGAISLINQCQLPPSHRGGPAGCFGLPYPKTSYGEGSSI